MKTVWLASWFRKVSVLGFLIATSALTACGGGGGGGGTPAPTTYLLGGTIQGAALNLTGTTSYFAGDASVSPKYTLTNGLFGPRGMTTDGHYLYVVDSQNNDVIQISLTTGEQVELTSNNFNIPYGITTQDGKNFYVANAYGNNILQIVIPTNGDFSMSTVSILAGDGNAAELDGVGTSAEFNEPVMLTTDGTYLYVTDDTGNAVRRVTIADGTVVTLVPASKGILPFGITLAGSAANASLYVTDATNNQLWLIQNQTSSDLNTVTMTPFCGSGAAGNSAGSGTCATAEFNWPEALTSDGTFLYVTDFTNTDLRRINIQKGTVDAAPMIDATANAGQFSSSQFVSMTTDGSHLYVLDLNNNNVILVQ
jgi:hypothetical protein